MSNSRPTHALIMTTQALTDALNSARTQLDRSRMLNLNACHGDDMHALALSLDAARTRLIQDGEEFLDVAHILLDSARRRIAYTTISADRAGRLLAVGS